MAGAAHITQRAIHPRLGRRFKEIKPKERERSLELELSGGIGTIFLTKPSAFLKLELNAP